MQAGAENRKGAAAQSGSTDNFRVCEVYVSLQGEGRLTGTKSLFLRTSGCNLRCWFCDTPFASWNPEGEFQTRDQLLHRIGELDLGDVHHVVITGGEPMIYPGLAELTEVFRNEMGMHITIETAATVDLPVVCDLMSISPKLSGSAPAADAGSWVERHHQRREKREVVERFMQDYDYQLKFVIDRREDVTEVLDYLGRLPNYDPKRVLLMPQGTEVSELEQRAAWLQPLAGRYGFQFCPRSHIQWFGNRRAT